MSAFSQKPPSMVREITHSTLALALSSSLSMYGVVSTYSAEEVRMDTRVLIGTSREVNNNVNKCWLLGYYAHPIPVQMT
jgi:hypothetical protein